jgi:hypothetical protein
MDSIGTHRLRAGERRKMNHQQMSVTWIGDGQDGLSCRRGIEPGCGCRPARAATGSEGP